MKFVSSSNRLFKASSPEQALVVVGSPEQPNHPSDYANRRTHWRGGGSAGTH